MQGASSSPSPTLNFFLWFTLLCCNKMIIHHEMQEIWHHVSLPLSFPQFIPLNAALLAFLRSNFYFESNLSCSPLVSVCVARSLAAWIENMNVVIIVSHAFAYHCIRQTFISQWSRANLTPCIQACIFWEAQWKSIFCHFIPNTIIPTSHGCRDTLIFDSIMPQ